MRTTRTIIDVVYNLLNVSSVTGDFSLYKFKRPLNSENNDIVINSPSNKNDAVQQAIINVNAYVPDIQGEPDSDKLDAIEEVLYSLIEGFQNNTGTFVDIEIFDSTILSVHEQNNWSFLNIKLLVRILNNNL